MIATNIDFLNVHFAKKNFFNSVLVRADLFWNMAIWEIWQFVPNTRCTFERLFCPWLVFRIGCLNLNKEVLIAVVFWPAGLNTPLIQKIQVHTWYIQYLNVYTYNVHTYIQYLNVVELIHCSNRLFMRSQFIFSNSVKH